LQQSTEFVAGVDRSTDEVDRLTDEAEGTVLIFGHDFPLENALAVVHFLTD
jgi:hypothetical protein